jgi:hypothetical protein
MKLLECFWKHRSVILQTVYRSGTRPTGHAVLVCPITVTVTLQHDNFDACAMCLAF